MCMFRVELGLIVGVIAVDGRRIFTHDVLIEVGIVLNLCLAVFLISSEITMVSFKRLLLSTTPTSYLKVTRQ